MSRQPTVNLSEIRRLLEAGHTQKETAEMVGLARATVSYHAQNMRAADAGQPPPHRGPSPSALQGAIPGDWADEALCAQTEPDLFYPLPGHIEMQKEAITICATCPVRSECLQHALDNDEQWGVWGGLTERQRAQLRRKASA